MPRINRERRNRAYSEYSRTCSRFTDRRLNAKKLHETDYTTRESRRSGWNLYKAVYRDWGQYFEDGSTHRAAYQCVPVFPTAAKATYTHVQRERLDDLIETVLRDPNVDNMTMRINGVAELRQQVVECIVCNDLSAGTRYTEDRKKRAEDRRVRIIENIVDVRKYGHGYYIVTTQNTRLKRPYLYGRFEKLFGEFADEEIEDAVFRICYKVPKATLNTLCVFKGGMRGYHVV